MSTPSEESGSMWYTGPPTKDMVVVAIFGFICIALLGVLAVVAVWP